MAKKRLNSDALMQEFQENSVFFRKPQDATEAVAASSPVPSPLSPPTNTRLPVGDAQSAEVPASLPPEASVRTHARTPHRRSTKRCPFDIYQDQLDSLKLLALEEQQRYGKSSMSAMVREAIDAYLTKRDAKTTA
ncbi:MAG TPA: hypothetical protein PKA05_14085 [Roseiflexaceae bacterium]|mgnify:CR=1 FL=1|nr:hypothetical protein [Roseiflexaceae bacterium]HMP41506.1 hypothetical protein [Roseiflexaceae bacterium]